MDALDVDSLQNQHTSHIEPHYDSDSDSDRDGHGHGLPKSTEEDELQRLAPRFLARWHQIEPLEGSHFFDCKCALCRGLDSSMLQHATPDAILTQIVHDTVSEEYLSERADKRSSILASDAYATMQVAVRSACSALTTDALFKEKADAINAAKWTFLGAYFKFPTCCVAFYISYRLQRTAAAKQMTAVTFKERFHNGVYLCDACAVAQRLRDADNIAWLVKAATKGEEDAMLGLYAAKALSADSLASEDDRILRAERSAATAVADHKRQRDATNSTAHLGDHTKSDSEFLLDTTFKVMGIACFFLVAFWILVLNSQSKHQQSKSRAQS